MSSSKYFQIVGCGHSESLEHFNNNALVRSDKGIMLIDCGHTIKHALSKIDLDFSNVNAIFITHVHGDHVFGLERAAYELRFLHNKKIPLIFHESIYEELWENTLKGSLGRNSDGECALEDYFDVIPLTSFEFSCLGNNYKIFEVKHTPGKKTFGVCLNDKIFYSSDTIAIPEIINSIEFEVGFHDVTLTLSNPVHATLNSLIEAYSPEIRKKLYLMSYQDNWKKHEKIVNSNFIGFAKQGMKVFYE